MHLNTELAAQLKHLVEVDPATQDKMVAMAEKLGQPLLNPQLVAKFVQEQHLHLPLFKHAQQQQAEAAAAAVQ